MCVADKSLVVLPRAIERIKHTYHSMFVTVNLLPKMTRPTKVESHVFTVIVTSDK